MEEKRALMTVPPPFLSFLRTWMDRVTCIIPCDAELRLVYAAQRPPTRRRRKAPRQAPSLAANFQLNTDFRIRVWTLSELPQDF